MILRSLQKCTQYKQYYKSDNDDDDIKLIEPYVPSRLLGIL